MIELLEKLLGKKPTTAKVDAAIQKVQAEIGTLTARQSAIVDALAIDDTATDALTQEHANIGLRLAALDKRMQLLTQERREAVQREFSAAIEGMVKPIADEMAELKEVKPQLDEAARRYNELARAEQRLRSRLNIAQGTLTDDANALADEMGIDRRAVSAAIATAKGKYPAASEFVAPSAEKARALMMAYPNEGEA